jgi:hypothetical protein
MNRENYSNKELEGIHLLFVCVMAWSEFYGSFQVNNVTGGTK